MWHTSLDKGDIFPGSQLILFIIYELLIKTKITTTALCDNYFGNYKTSPFHLAYIYKLKIGLSMSADQKCKFSDGLINKLDTSYNCNSNYWPNWGSIKRHIQVRVRLSLKIIHTQRPCHTSYTTPDDVLQFH